MANISLRAHHVENLAYHMFRNFRDSQKLQRGYSPGFGDFVRGLYQTLLNNPSIMVKIVSGLDDICNHTNPKCNKKNEGCSVTGGRDELAERCYGLNIGQEYSVEDLLRRAIQFKEKSGFLTPLNWHWRTNNIALTLEN